MKKVWKAIAGVFNNHVFGSYKSTVIGIALIVYVFLNDLDTYFHYALIVLGVILILGKYEWIDKLLGTGSKRDDAGGDTPQN